MTGKLLAGIMAIAGAAAVAGALLLPVESSGPGGGPVSEQTPGLSARALEKAQPLPIKEASADFYDLSFRVELTGRAPLLLTTGFPAGVYVKVEKDRASLGFISGGALLERVEGSLYRAESHTVLLRRRDAFYDLAVDDTMIGGVSFDSTVESDFKVAGKGVQVDELRFQPVREPVVFGDDFMRERVEGSPWENVSGRWETIGLKHPSLSANPFRLSSVGAKTITVVGKPFWDAYRASVSVLGAANQKVGIVFSYKEEDDYCLFRWAANGADGEGRAEVISFRNGGYSILAEKNGGYTPGVWYKLELVTGMGWTRIYVDEHPMLEVVHPAITGGLFGLYADGANRSYFDDTIIGPYQEAAYNGTGSFRYFRPLSGDWLEGRERITADARAEEGFPALYACATDWREWSVRGKVNAGDNCGVAAAVVDPLNFLALVVRGGEVVLAHRKAGAETVLASQPVSFDAGAVELSLSTSRSIARGIVRTAAGEEAVLSAPIPSGLSGGAGLVAFSGRADFGPEVCVSIPERQEAILTGNATFSSESSMSVWAGEMSDWYVGKGGSYWYRGFFTGDVEVMAELNDAKMPPGGLIALGVKKSGEGAKPMNGYVFTVERPALGAAAKPGAGTVGWTDNLNTRLYREGEEITSCTTSPDALYTVGLRTAGETVAGYINGIPVITYRDPDAAGVTGYKVAYKAKGVNIQPGDVLVTSSQMRDYRFSTAPMDWRVGAGAWEVTSRWQCDPRWSFFSGRHSGKGKPVLIWNKRRFTDPVRIEFYAAFKMQRERGNRYEYARDINVSLSPDGEDMLNGYSFVYGGFNNKRNVITRRDKIVASTKDGVITRSMRIHRHWFHIVVEKDGDEITFNVDDGKVKLRYKDPEPIDAGRVAIWSYDCSIMVSRVRISGGGGETAELPGFAADGVLNTIYDTELEEPVVEKEKKK